MDGPHPHLARRRALYTLCATVLGTVITDHTHSVESLNSTVWFSLSCGFIACSIIARGRTKSILMLLGIVLLSAGWSGLRVHEPAVDRIDQVHRMNQKSSEKQANFQRSTPIEITGIILEPISTQYRARQPGDPPTWSTQRTTTELRVDQVYLNDTSGRGTWVSATGIVRVLLAGDSDGHDKHHEIDVYEPGQRVQVLGMFKPLGHARNLGEPDWAMLSAQSNRVGTLVVPDRSMIEPIEHTDLFNELSGRWISMRSTLRRRAMHALGIGNEPTIDGDDQGIHTHRAVAGALLLGLRSPAFGEVYSTFQRVGVAHVLAISGFHLALVVMIGMIAIRFVGEHARIESIVIIGILIACVIFIPMRPPIVRAAVIVLSLLIADRMGRRYDRLTLLAWVGVGLLIWRPMDAFSLGYQLSMGITALLVLLAGQQRIGGFHQGVIRGSLSPKAFHNQRMNRLQHTRSARFIQYALDILKTNFACWIAAMPIIMYHAGIVSVLAPVASIVLIPLVMLLMIAGYVQIMIGIAMPNLSIRTIWVSDWLSQQTSSLVGWFDQIPGSSIQASSPGVLWTIGTTLVIIAVITRRWGLRQRKTIGGAAVLIAWASVAYLVTQDRAALRIDMLDVGDGTSFVLHADNEALLWDCGSLDYRVGNMATRALNTLKVRRINDVIITHDNIDHFNGLINLAQEIRVDRVWVSRAMLDRGSVGWRETQTRLIGLGIEIHEIQAGDSIKIGSATLECLWPDPELMDMTSDDLNDNNTSIVMQVRVPVQMPIQKPVQMPDLISAPGDSGSGDDHRTVLLTGDIEHEAMELLIDRYPDLRADIMELPHHGSTKRGAREFVYRIDPSIVLQSTGFTRMDDPYWDALRSSQRWYTTASGGGAWVRIDHDGSISHGWAIE